MTYFIPSRYSSHCTRAAALSFSVASVLLASPARAFTLAGSQGVFSFDNFSTAPFSINSSTQTNTFVTGSSANAIADADARFVVLPSPQAGNLISNLAFSPAFSSIALAQSEASIIGSFAIAAGETFSFDFFGTIDLLTATEQPTDFATASLGVQYSVLAFDPDTAIFNELDYLTLFGEISTPSGTDSLSIFNSPAIALTLLNTTNNTGAAQTTETISAQIAGRYERMFDRPTTRTLAEAKIGTAAIETQNIKAVPTPDISIAGWTGVVGLMALRKRKSIKDWLSQKRIDG